MSRTSPTSPKRMPPTMEWPTVASSRMGAGPNLLFSGRMKDEERRVATGPTPNTKPYCRNAFVLELLL